MFGKQSVRVHGFIDAQRKYDSLRIIFFYSSLAKITPGTGLKTRAKIYIHYKRDEFYLHSAHSKLINIIRWYVVANRKTSFRDKYERYRSTKRVGYVLEIRYPYHEKS